MNLSEIQEALTEMRPESDEPEDAAMVLNVKAGQVAEAEIKIDAASEELSEEEIAEFRRDAVGGLVVAAAEYASEHDIDIDRAAEERVDRMSELAEKHKAVQEAVESGDAAALAEALGAQQNEVPTGDDDFDERGVY